jgi:protocatechuate 3,4-dioxygenase beta subunit
MTDWNGQMRETDRKRLKGLAGKLSRRDALEVLGVATGLTGIAGVALAGCGSSPTSPTTTATSSTTTTTTTNNSACAVTPSETEGPYPDKTGMINNASFFRRDMPEGKTGLPLTLILTVVNVSSSCAAVANANVEIWQCDGEGHYSEYSQQGYDGTGQTFLRGVQTTNAGGQVTFTTIYPGWYAGRATHIHVDVFVNGAIAKTTQIAFPESTSSAVYKTGIYAAKGQNSITNGADNVFSDGTTYEMISLAGDTSSGYVGTLTIGISV